MSVDSESGAYDNKAIVLRNCNRAAITGTHIAANKNTTDGVQIDMIDVTNSTVIGNTFFGGTTAGVRLTSGGKIGSNQNVIGINSMVCGGSPSVMIGAGCDRNRVVGVDSEAKVIDQGSNTIISAC